MLVVEGNIEILVFTDSKPIGGCWYPVLMRLHTRITVQYIDIIRNTRTTHTTDDGVFNNQEVARGNGSWLTHPKCLISIDIHSHKIVALRVLTWCHATGHREIQYAIFTILVDYLWAYSRMG